MLLDCEKENHIALAAIRQNSKEALLLQHKQNQPSYIHLINLESCITQVYPTFSTIILVSKYSSEIFQNHEPIAG